MSYFNENANPWLPHPDAYRTPLAPPDNSAQRAHEWKAFAEKLSANFQAVVKQKDQIIEEVVEQREAAYTQRDAWKKTAVELRNRLSPDMSNDQLLEIYDKKKEDELKALERERAAQGKN